MALPAHLVVAGMLDAGDALAEGAVLPGRDPHDPEDRARLGRAPPAPTSLSCPSSSLAAWPPEARRRRAKGRDAGARTQSRHHPISMWSGRSLLESVRNHPVALPSTSSQWF
jgi:hypothetical protein